MNASTFIKKTLIFAVFAAVVAISALSCVKDSPKKLIKQGLYKCQDRLRTAELRMGKKGYSDAVRVLEEIKYQCGGSPYMDTVYYYAGICHFRMKQYEDARTEFELLYREYPRSPFVDEAHYRIAQMRYLRSQPPRRDQTETKEAMRLFNDYIEEYPRGNFVDSAKILYMNSLNKLAEKELNNAYFYRKDKKFQAALIYYRTVLSEYPDSKYAPESIVGMAEMLLELGRSQDAAEIVGELDIAAFSSDLKVRVEAVRQKL